jgi:hypothetical protein
VDTACVDDPNGVLAATGGCAAVLPLGCDTDLNTVDATAPVGTLVSLFCPASCDEGCATAGDTVDTACVDDPDGHLAAMGSSCAAAVGGGCSSGGGNSLVAMACPVACGTCGQCQSAMCRMGHCSDADAGSDELGGFADCAAAVAAAGGDCSASWPSGGSGELGLVCAHSCGWCFNFADMEDPTKLDVPTCASMTIAACAATDPADPAKAATCRAAVDLVAAPHPAAQKIVCEATAGCTHVPGAYSPPGCVGTFSKFTQVCHRRA